MIIKNQKEWNGYKKIREKRAENFRPAHSAEPKEYPCHVVTYMTLDGAVVKFYHSFFYVDDARKLIGEK